MHFCLCRYTALRIVVCLACLSFALALGEKATALFFIGARTNLYCDQFFPLAACVPLHIFQFALPFRGDFFTCRSDVLVFLSSNSHPVLRLSFSSPQRAQPCLSLPLPQIVARQALQESPHTLYSCSCSCSCCGGALHSCSGGRFPQGFPQRRCRSIRPGRNFFEGFRQTLQLLDWLAGWLVFPNKMCTKNFQSALP